MRDLGDYIKEYGCALFIVVIILITIGTCVHDGIEERKERKERIAHREHLKDSVYVVRLQDSLDAVKRKDSIKNLPKEEKKELIGEFLYKDKGGCIHRIIDCKEVRHSKLYDLLYTDEFGLERVAVAPMGFSYSFNRVRKTELKKEDLFYCCSSCINDSIYNVLLDIIKNPKKPNPMDDNNIPPSRRLMTNSLLQESGGKVFQ